MSKRPSRPNEVDLVEMLERIDNDPPAFDLTDAERALLECFLDGQTTQEMAVTQGRSHATIRTQFHSLMSKMGARSQTASVLIPCGQGGAVSR